MRQICDYGKEAGTMVKVGIIGATGYAGQELVRILLGHKDAEIGEGKRGGEFVECFGNNFDLERFDGGKHRAREIGPEV